MFSQLIVSTEFELFQLAFLVLSDFCPYCVGLDDLRDWTNNVQPTIPIYVTLRDLEVCPAVFLPFIIACMHALENDWVFLF